MPTKNKSKSIHSQRLKSIRKYVDFDYDLRKELTPYQKKKVKKYFDEVNELTARPFQVYRSKNKKRLETVQGAAQHTNKLKGLKVAFIPTNGEEKLKVQFDKKGKVKLKGKYVTTTPIEFDMDLFIDNPVEETIRRLKDDSGKAYTVQAGPHEIPTSHSKALLPDYINILTSKYTELNEDGSDNNHYFGNWLFGVNSHVFDNQTNIQDYLDTKQKNKKKLQKKRRNEKRRNKRNVMK
jgi:hypothetical protein